MAGDLPELILALDSSVALRPEQVRCEIYTYKEGLFSKVAHDLLLEISCATLSLVGTPARVQATFRAAELRVICAMSHGERSAHKFSRGDLRKIDENTARDVLRVDKNPEIRFVAEPLAPDVARLHGTLTLLGKSCSVGAQLERQGDRIVAIFNLDQRDFGIRPFSALFGTIRIQSRVKVVVSLPVAVVESR